MSLDKLKQELKSYANTTQNKKLSRFFKTGKNEYAEGDIFLGVNVPQQRKIAKKYQFLSLAEIKKLLLSKIHEHRQTALLILLNKYRSNSKEFKEKAYNFYLKNITSVNNWDLVDISAPKIIGDYLLDKPQKRGILYKLSKSKNLWERRIAILSTFAFIKNKQFKDTLKISRILLLDKHDLIHKAVGWMLREVGKINQEIEETFLQKYCQNMPRTMLRYAIEKFPEGKRKFYLKKG